MAELISPEKETEELLRQREERRKQYFIAHRFNFLKLRVFDCMLRHHPKKMTSKAVADELGIPMQAVSKIFSRSCVRKYGYVRRHPKAKGSRYFQYTLTKKGIRTYMEYLIRLKCGFSLNLHNKSPEKMANFCGKYPKDLNLKTWEAREITHDEMNAYIRIVKKSEANRDYKDVFGDDLVSN